MVWSDSYLNLPLGIFPPSAASLLGLDTYPAPFSFDSTLGSSAFLLQKGNPDAWRAALQVASFLGDRANGALTTLGAFYADEIPAEEKANYNLLIVGQPSKLPVMAELNETLPAPFLDGGDIASQSNLQVTFRLPPSSPLGYLEMIPSPWNPDKVVLTIVGNSAAGVHSAGSALVDPILRPSLAGNFAVIDGTQIVTGDTRMLASPQVLGAIPTSSVSEAGSPSDPIDITAPTPVRPAWILPTLIISIVLVLVVLVLLAVGQWRNQRPKSRPKES
jgi:hypothetical protein